MTNNNKIEKIGSRERILEEFIMMMQGSKLTKPELEKTYLAGYRAITVDFKTIKKMLETYLPDCEMHSDRDQKTYEIKNSQGAISSEKILAILKILIGSRAFNKKELKNLKDELLNLVPVDQHADLKQLIAATLSKYTPVAKSSNYDLLELVKMFSEYIIDKRKIEFTYSSSTGSSSAKYHVGVPLNLYFDTFYFYVTVYIIDKGQSYNYRLDRFQTVTPKRKTFNVPTTKKEDEGAAIKKTNLLKMGNDVHYKFRYWNYPQTALDRLQGSRITHKYEDGSVAIEGEIYAEGAKLFILSQGDKIKVMEPASLVEQVKETYQKALKLYQ